MKRSEHIHQLRTLHFDCLIIGGGASGAGCALDSTLRGYRTAIVEKHDFAAATSSKSTKLIHGGVRYLERAFKKTEVKQLKQVRHGLLERKRLLQNAPHLAQPLPLLTPVYSWLEGLYYKIGLSIYDLFASSKSHLPRSRWLSKQEACQRIPQLNENIHSAVRYYDAQFNDARYNLAIIQTAAQANATVVNHLAIHAFEYNTRGHICAALGRDLINGDRIKIKTKLVINCTGPYSDKIRQLANPKLSNRLFPSKGVHLTLPSHFLGGDEALLIPTTEDDRILFAIPFQGKVIVGTTDTALNDITRLPELQANEVDFLLSTLNRYLKEEATPADVTAGFGGLRPLVTAEKQLNTKALLRDHEVEHDYTSNLISLMGGKWTTYRLMAQDTLDYISTHIFPAIQPCQTHSYPLVGAEGYSDKLHAEIYTATQLPLASCTHLVHQYGGTVHQVLLLLDENVEYSAPLIKGYPFIHAEVIYAIRHEMAYTIEDILARRLRLEILDWEACLTAAPLVAHWLETECHWAPESTANHLKLYTQRIKRLQQQHN